MDKVLDTFYKGNVRHFGLGAWNSVKDDFNEVSKSQNIKMPFSNNINNPSSIYNQQNHQNLRYNHFSPNLIRMQYFDDNLKQIEHRRNLYLEDYFKNAKNNVYYDKYDPLLDRRKNVQIKLENIKNKLINDEQRDLMRKQKKIEEENRIIDNLILENEKKDDKIFQMLEDNDKKNYENEYNYDIDEQIKSRSLNNKLSKVNSVLVLSRTPSNSSTSNDIDFNLLKAEEENNDIFSPNKSLYKTKNSKLSTKRKSPRHSISTKKRKHTNILKVLMNIDKQSVPISNINDELVEQSRQAGITFSELYYDIKNLKKDIKEKISNLHENNENNMNVIKDILMMCENNNIKRSIENNIYRNGNKKLKIDKNYLDPEINEFKNQIEETIDTALDNYGKKKVTEDYDLKLQNEPIYMENDYNYRIKNNERSKYGSINVTNLYNRIEKLNDVTINPTNFNKVDNRHHVNKIPSPSDSKNYELFTFYNNKEDNIFPALEDLNEKISKDDKSENKNINDINNIKNKKNKKHKHRKVIVKDLGKVGDDYDGHKDHRKERKETIIEFKNENDFGLYKNILNKNNNSKSSKEQKSKIEKSDKSESLKESITGSQSESNIENQTKHSKNKNNKSQSFSENESSKSISKKGTKKTKNQNNTNKSQKLKENIDIIKEENEDNKNDELKSSNNKNDK